MNKEQFITALRTGLKKHNIKDIDDILLEYEDYFRIQRELGKTEDDIAKRLGDITSIVDDYASSGSSHKKRWFDLVTISFVAIPLLILLYGVLIVFVGSAIASWGIAIYYLFGLDTLSFMPHIPVGVHLIYVLLMLEWTVFFFSISVRFGAMLKAMTMQYVVKQSIRIGEYQIKRIYHTLLKYSLMIGVTVFVIGYMISALIAQDWQYWHVWGWFR